MEVLRQFSKHIQVSPVTVALFVQSCYTAYTTLLEKYTKIPHSNGACHKLMLLTSGENSGMHREVQSGVVQTCLSLDSTRFSQKK